MIFQVIRTSMYADENEKPYEKCVPIRLYSEWGKEVWGIEINSLEELMKFKEIVDEEIIITTSPQNNKTPTIEIYDDYRE